MCGRYQQALDPAELVELYRIQREAWGRPPRAPAWNVAPRQSVPVIIRDETGQRVGVTMRWGFPPMWLAKQGKEPFDAPPLVNAMSEEAAKKPTWSKALRERRCLVPTTGFYEWLTIGKERFPLHFRPSSGKTLTLAGVWSPFDWGEKKGWPCMSILTTSPNALVAPVHNRMPVVLSDEAAERWLAPDADPGGFFGPGPDGALIATEANRALNSREAEGPEMVVADWVRSAV